MLLTGHMAQSKGKTLIQQQKQQTLFISQLLPNKYIQLILLVGTDVCISVVCMWEKTRVPRGNQPVQLSNHITISHASPGIKPESQR